MQVMHVEDHDGAAAIQSSHISTTTFPPGKLFAIHVQTQLPFKCALFQPNLFSPQTVEVSFHCHFFFPQQQNLFQTNQNALQDLHGHLPTKASGAIARKRKKKAGEFKQFRWTLFFNFRAKRSSERASKGVHRWSQSEAAQKNNPHTSSLFKKSIVCFIQILGRKKKKGSVFFVRCVAVGVDVGALLFSTFFFVFSFFSCSRYTMSLTCPRLTLFLTALSKDMFLLSQCGTFRVLKKEGIFPSVAKVSRQRLIAS